MLWDWALINVRAEGGGVAVPGGIGGGTVMTIGIGRVEGSEGIAGTVTNGTAIGIVITGVADIDQDRGPVIGTGGKGHGQGAEIMTSTGDIGHRIVGTHRAVDVNTAQIEGKRTETTIAGADSHFASSRNTDHGVWRLKFYDKWLSRCF